eukprot:2266689-Rhodomonas_salina.2
MMGQPGPLPGRFQVDSRSIFGLDLKHQAVVVEEVIADKTACGRAVCRFKTPARANTRRERSDDDQRRRVKARKSVESTTS